MIDRILVPLDGSRLAERALGHALRLGRQSGAEVILLRVPVLEKMLVPSIAGYDLFWPEQAWALSRAECEAYLETVLAANADAGVRLRALVEDGDVATAILDTAAREGAGLIAMSTHGYSGITRWVLGSVTERVCHVSACPVLVVRSTEPFQHLLIPLDGSALAENALKPGLEIAPAAGGEVTLLRAVQLDEERVAYLEGLENGLGQRARNLALSAAEEYLESLSAQYRRPGLDLQAAVVEASAAEAILEYADPHSVDLIAMATHGHTGLRRWIYGSVTDKVLHHARCSMLITRPAADQLN